jgi:hypothetical protein
MRLPGVLFQPALLHLHLVLIQELLPDVHDADHRVEEGPEGRHLLLRTIQPDPAAHGVSPNKTAGLKTRISTGHHWC